jgi:hypothetical protein
VVFPSRLGCASEPGVLHVHAGSVFGTNHL